MGSTDPGPSAPTTRAGPADSRQDGRWSSLNVVVADASSYYRNRVPLYLAWPTDAALATARSSAMAGALLAVGLLEDLTFRTRHDSDVALAASGVSGALRVGVLLTGGKAAAAVASASADWVAVQDADLSAGATHDAAGIRAAGYAGFGSADVIRMQLAINPFTHVQVPGAAPFSVETPHARASSGGGAIVDLDYRNGDHAPSQSAGSENAAVYAAGGGGNDLVYAVPGLIAAGPAAAGDAASGGTSEHAHSGSSGNETLDLSGVLSQGSVIDLAHGTQTGPNGATEPLHNVENVVGTQAGDTIIGNGSVNVIDGEDGDDFITGGPGTDDGDTLRGGAGNDTLEGLSGADTLNGGIGDDILRGGAGVDMLNGGDGNDLIQIFNGEAIDVVDGGAGIDTLDMSAELTHAVIVDLGAGTYDGTGGTQTIASIENVIGTQAADTITGSAADNVLDGQGGNDNIAGGDGNDTIIGGAGDDTMAGGLGDDTYYVDAAGDIVIEAPDAGADTVFSSIDYTLGTNVENLTLTGGAITGNGNARNNIIMGNDLDNVLRGFAGDDIIIALAGDDLLDGGTGSDNMAGQRGNDTYVVDSTGDVVTELPGEGVDTVLSAITYTLGANVENLTLTGTAAINGTGNAADNVLIGNRAANVLTGGAGNDQMAGGAGNDIYYVDSPADVVIELPGEGNDRVYTTVSYTLSSQVEDMVLSGTAAITGIGNALNNTISANAAGDGLNGAAGNDTLFGGIGDDTLDGGPGTDTMSGGLGNDSYYVDSPTDVVLEAVGAGIDTVYSTIRYTLAPALENLTLLGTSNIAGLGNALNNILIGNSGANVLIGGAGDDTMMGGIGNDTYYVDTPGDVVTELPGQGTDRVYSPITYTLTANVEQLVLTGLATIDGTGNALDNSVTGNAANNVLTGLGGNDTLNGGSGSDTMIGGAGDDIYFVDTMGDVVIEALNEGVDRVNSSITYTLPANVEVLALLGGAPINATGNALTNLLAGNVNANVLDGGAGVDTMNGGLGDDTYIVDSSADIVNEAVNAGFDTVLSSATYTLSVNVENLTLTGSAAINGTGNSANNTITGNAKANVLTGGAGDDVIDGGAGNDRMIGGAGSETYFVDSTGDVIVEAPGEGTDRVFSSATYTLSANVENLTLTGTAAIDGTGNAGDNSLVGNSAHNVLTGGAGNDALDGRAGDDTMVGGAGNDTYAVDSVGDVVIEAAGEGTDRINSSVSYTLPLDVEILALTGNAAINATGNAQVNLIAGNAAANVLDGGAGIDTLSGGGGDDTLVYDAADSSIQGGAGVDTLRLPGSGQVLDLTIVPNTLITDVEIVDLTGTGNNTARFALGDVLAISSTTDTLRIDGNAGDRIIVTDGASWHAGADQVIGGNTYHTYTNGAGTLIVDTDITAFF